MAAGATDTEVNRHAPRLSAELPNGTRLQGFIPPVTARPVLVLRLHREVVIPLDDYVSAGFMNVAAADAIRQALRERRNIMVVGPTGSGKTTLANAMLMELASSADRIAILEDTRELRCDAPNTVRLRSSRVVSLRELVQDSLRIKPDRIVIGEIRSGAVARETLNAWNTGHPGGIATIHADSAADTLHRLEHLLSEEFAVPPRHLIGRSIDDIIFIGVSGGSARLQEHIRVGWSGSRNEYELASAVGRTADS
jgi:type IV secretion system protein VirB11